MPFRVLVQTIEPFATKSPEEEWSWTAKACDDIDRASDTEGETAVRKFLDYICEELLLFTVSMCSKYYSMVRQVIGGFVTDDDIELQLGEFLENTLFHRFLRESFCLVARAFSMHDGVDDSDDDFPLFGIVQEVAGEPGSSNPLAVASLYFSAMNDSSQTPIGE